MTFPARQHITKTLNALIATVPETEKTATHIVLLAGESVPFRNDTDREMPFRQESNFYYLTGCQVPSSFLVIAYQAGTSVETNPSIHLLVPPINEADILWSVPGPTVAEAEELFPDTTKISVSTDIAAAISELVKTSPNAILHTLPSSRLYPSYPQDFLLDPSIKTTADYLLTALHKARLTKSPWEIAQIRKANDISSRAHETIMRVLAKRARNSSSSESTDGKPLLPGQWSIDSEPEAEAVFVASCVREGSKHQAYLPIVASSVRASTLHYCCNDKAFAWGPVEKTPFHHPNLHVGGRERAVRPSQFGEHETVPQVLLLDAGCEWENYASDITRTTPIGNGGKFSPEARDIYSLVLEIQEESAKILRPGVHWDEVQLLCHRILIKGFIKLGIFKPADEEDILNSGISAAFFPHGVGHSLGLDVHDVPSVSKPASGEGRSALPETLSEKAAHGIFRYLRLRLPLEEGMVVTVEPGIYFSPHILAPVRTSEYIDLSTLARYESVGGIRIEDAVAITRDGSENLTKVGKSVEWLEGVCSGLL